MTEGRACENENKTTHAVQKLTCNQTLKTNLIEL